MSRRPQPRITNRLRFTAYHEAGHAVVAFHEGTAIHKATIEPSEGRYGSVTYTNPSHGIKFDIDYTLRSRGRVRSLIRSSLAGAIAQKMKYL